MQASNKPPRLNFDVPRALVNEVKAIAESQNMEPYYWIRRVIQKAVEDSRSNSQP